MPINCLYQMKLRDKMAESSFVNFFNNARPFGLNVRVPEKTIRQINHTASNVAGGVLEPLFTYLEENEKVFSGDITHELNKTRAENFNMSLIMNAVDEKVNGPKPTFDTMF